MPQKYKWKSIERNSEIPNLFDIRQIYLWLISKDLKVIIVSKGGDNWQFPGGKPKVTETIRETIVREVKEETGVDIANQYSKVSPFGYYTVTQEENGEQVQFLQLRFYLFLKEKSSELTLEPIENPDDPDPIKRVAAVGLDQIEESIPWLTEVGEYPGIKKIVHKHSDT